MKIARSQLKKIIKEELQAVLNERGFNPFAMASDVLSQMQGGGKSGSPGIVSAPGQKEAGLNAISSLISMACLELPNVMVFGKKIPSPRHLLKQKIKNIINSETPLKDIEKLIDDLAVPLAPVLKAKGLNVMKIKRTVLDTPVKIPVPGLSGPLTVRKLVTQGFKLASGEAGEEEGLGALGKLAGGVAGAFGVKGKPIDMIRKVLTSQVDGFVDAACPLAKKAVKAAKQLPAGT